MPKLNIGSGLDIAKDWVNVDLYVNHPDIVKADILALPEEWTNNFDEILCKHALEHVSFHDIKKAIASLYRVLKPDGKCVIVVPDLDYCTEVFFSSKDGSVMKEWAFRMLYGTQDHPGEFHKCGFTEHSIKRHLTEAGFEIQIFTTAWSADQKTFLVQCTKNGKP